MEINPEHTMNLILSAEKLQTEIILYSSQYWEGPEHIVNGILESQTKSSLMSVKAFTVKA